MNLAIDLDGTLADWGDNHAACGEWQEGAKEALRGLLDGGDKVIVHSCRATWAAGGGRQEIARFLGSGGFRPVFSDVFAWADTLDPGEVGIWVGEGKPVAHWYIDDRAIEHRGNWFETLQRLRVKSLMRLPA